jgi:acetyltransferase
MLQEIPSKFPRKLEFDHEGSQTLIRNKLEKGHCLLTEMETKSVLSTYGIPVNRMEAVTTEDEAVQKAKKIGFPVVMKINSRDIPHKTDVGGVMLNLKNESDVYLAFRKIIERARSYSPKAHIEGVTIQPMLNRPGYELILGAKKDPDFGPVIVFGMGGVMTEVLKDRSIALPPLNRLLARRLMEETRVYRLLKGYRNHPPVNLVLLEEILIRLAQLVTDFPEIEELDINPLIVTGDDACAADARILLKPSRVKAPLHLIISPYPNECEARTVSKGGIGLFVRPIRPEDAPLLVELFESLSPRSIYRRFFTPMKRLSPKMLVRFTQIDYDREIALVAIRESESGEKMLGVARITAMHDFKNAEFAALVGDPWQGKGIGAELLERCLAIAEEREIETVCGHVLAENTQMLKLGKKLGFQIQWIQDSHEYELRMPLKNA